jgi:DNA-binding response OmpR family regulator
MKHPNLVQTRDRLLDLVWGYDSLVERNVVDVYIRYLRNKLDVSLQGYFMSAKLRSSLGKDPGRNWL